MFSFILIAINFLVSVIGFQNPGFLKKFLFHIDSILKKKEYIRVLSSGFLHANWKHLIFNMISFYFFGPWLEKFMGPAWFFLIYFASLLGGNALSLWLNRKNRNYSALGASGAVSGIVLGAVILMPNLRFYGFVPGWVFAIGYTLYSLNGIYKKTDNIGHDSHLGGAIAGVLVMLAYSPDLVLDRWWLLLALGVPISVFLYLYATGKIFTMDFGFLGKIGKGGSSGSTNDGRRDDEFYADLRRYQSKSGAESKSFYEKKQAEKARLFETQREIDLLLDKVAKKGAESLDAKERARLKYLSELLDSLKNEK